MYKFVWKIENFTNFKGEPLLSPYLRLHACTSLQLYYSAMNLCQLSITQGHSEIITYVPNLKDKVESPYCFHCSVSFLDFDGTPIMHKVGTIKSIANINVWPKMDKLIFPNESKYFPNNTLRVEFCIWRADGNESFLKPISMSLFAITRWDPNTKLVRKTIRPQVIGFSAEGTGIGTFQIYEPIWNEQSCEVKINFPNEELATVCLSTSMFGFRAKIKVSVLDASGKMIEFGNHDAPFTSAKRSSTFTLNATKAMFLRYKNTFLPLNTLRLVITCTFSGHFHANIIVEESDIFNNCTTNASAVVEVSKTEANETDTESDEPETRQENDETSPPNTIVQSLQDILKEGYLSDFNLKVGERIFPVHKTILGARSKVFRSMFASEMKETQDNCVNIKDVDADTLQRLLQFIYTDRIDKEQGWADASSLYAAADFYALEPLKQGCSKILKDGLSTTSILGVLYMADLHQDRQLKSAALDFISLNDQDIVGNENWIKFEKDNGNLALETLRELYLKKINR